MDRPFVEVDHSGDIAIEATGKTIGELIENMTLGLFSLMYYGEVEAIIDRSIRVRSKSTEDLLVDWLSEVIASASVHGELYGAVVVNKAGEEYVEAVLQGEKLDPEKHNLRFEVKAATYHGLYIEKRKNTFHARVLFDL